MHHRSLSLGLYIRLVTQHGLDLTRKNFNTTRHSAIFSYIYSLARVTILCYRECRCYCWVAMTGKLATDRITLLRKQQGLLTCLFLSLICLNSLGSLRSGQRWLSDSTSDQSLFDSHSSTSHWLLKWNLYIGSTRNSFSHPWWFFERRQLWF